MRYRGSTELIRLLIPKFHTSLTWPFAYRGQFVRVVRAKRRPFIDVNGPKEGSEYDQLTHNRSVCAAATRTERL